jgi:hypothetical protein
MVGGWPGRALGRFLATVELPGGEAQDPIGHMTGSFTSSRYGYSIRYPEGWDTEPATRDWTVATVRPESEAMDRFDETDASAARPRVTIAAADLPAATDLDAWLATAMPSRLRKSHALLSCSTGHGLQAYSDEWSRPRPIGRHLVRAREACGFVEGVIVVGDRGYVFSAEGAVRVDGPDPLTRAKFEAVVATFDP